MKRNNLILGFVICALLLVGIGFAELTATLVFSDTVTSTPSENFDVVFVDGTGYSVDAQDAHNASIDLQEIASHKGFVKQGDKVTIQLTVKNMSPDYSAKLTSVTATPENDTYFSITATPDETLGTTFTDTTTITVVIELRKAALTEQSCSFTVTIKADPVNR